MTKIAILTIGSEVVDGRVLDTNANFLSWELCLRGQVVSFVSSCRDNLTDIFSLLNYACSRAEIIIVSGGLGTTSDDLTRQALSEFTKNPLYQDIKDLERLKKIFIERKREFNSVNEIQTFFPTSAKIINNPVGLASGFSLEHEGRKFICLPGVPEELKSMCFETVFPSLDLAKSNFSQETIKILGVPESQVGAKIESLKLSSEIIVSYRAAFPDVHVVLRGEDKEQLKDAAQQISQIVGQEYIFTQNYQETFIETLQRLFLLSGKTLALAESCTGGLAQSLITSVSGSSKYFLGGVVSYSNSIKEKILGVPSELINKHGAVSAEVALAMARGARERLNSDIAVSITGIAGPQGGSETKPAGVFYIGLAGEDNSYTQACYFKARRTSFQKYASFVALDAARRELLGLNPPKYCEFK